MQLSPNFEKQTIRLTGKKKTYGTRPLKLGVRGDMSWTTKNK